MRYRRFDSPGGFDVNDISKERRIIPGGPAIPKSPPMSEAQRVYNGLPKSQAIKNPPGYPGGPYGGSKDPLKND